jgi:hypothetical protein
MPTVKPAVADSPTLSDRTEACDNENGNEIAIGKEQPKGL